jgi:hypothetical protein
MVDEPFLMEYTDITSNIDDNVAKHNRKMYN